MTDDSTTPKGTEPRTQPSRSRFCLTPRARVILLLAPAVLLVCILLGSWALRALGVRASKYAEVNLKALGNFTFDDVKGRTQDIPQPWRDLDGRRVALTGFPISAQTPGTGPQTYSLVYQLASPSGYGRPPHVQERVVATAPPSTTPFSQYDLVRLEGVLHVGVQRNQSGAVTSVFRMDVDSAADLENDTSATAPAQVPRVEFCIAFLISYLVFVAIVMVKEWPWRDVQARRARAGLCPSCGYDMRASTRRCPECGAMIRDRPAPASRR